LAIISLNLNESFIDNKPTNVVAGFKSYIWSYYNF